MSTEHAAETIVLPAPVRQGVGSLEEALAARRSVREFTDESLAVAILSQLAWATAGMTSPSGGRTAPSAGATYPLELYVVLPAGVYRYVPARHELHRRADGDRRAALSHAALEQEAVARAPATFVLTAVFDRITPKYGRRRAPRYVHIEVGHAAQNLHLQAVALGLASVPVGAFDDDRVAQVLGLPADEVPVYLVPVGHAAA